MLFVEESRERRIIRREVVKRLHFDIHGRYRSEHLVAVPEISSKNMLEGIGQADIDRLESLFLSTVYPELDAREQRDRSFESLIRMLKNPHALSDIIPSLPRIVLRYGTRFPIALRIGLNSVMAFNHAMKLENKMVEYIAGIYGSRKEEVTPSLILDWNDYHEAYVKVPYAEGVHMIKLARWIMKAGASSDIMNTAWNIMDEVEKSLVKKDESRRSAGAEPAHEQDVVAIEYGKKALDNIKSTFSDYERGVMLRMIEISFATEIDYLDRMYDRN